MTKYRIKYDRKGCIGAGVCAAIAEKHWEMNKDGLADLINGKEVDGFFEKIIDESELEIVKKAAENCPVNVIHIIDEETGKQII